MKPELKNLTEKQEEECRDIIMYWDLDEFDRGKIKTFIAKIRKESMEYEREQILKSLPKSVPGSPLRNNDVYSAGFIECFKQVKQLLKEL